MHREQRYWTVSYTHLDVYKRQNLDSMGISEEIYRELSQGARNPNRGEGGNTPTLEQYSRDLTALAEEGKLDPVVGREPVSYTHLSSWTNMIPLVLTVWLCV